MTSSRLKPHVWALAPAALLLLALSIYPTLYLVRLALSDWTPRSPEPVLVGLVHLRRLLFADVFFWKSLWLTLLFTVLALTVELLLGLLLAHLLVGRPHPGPHGDSGDDRGGAGPRLQALLRTALMVPMMVTPVVVGLGWRILFDPDLGLLNVVLGQLGIVGPAWVADPRTALLSVALVDVWQWTPFMFLTLGASLAQQSREPYEAAAIDGAGSWAVFWHVTLPGLRRTLAAAVLIRAIDLFKTFDILFIITEGGPGTSTETLNLYAFRVLRRFDIGYAAALGLVLLIFTMVASGLLGRVLERREPEEAS